MAKVDDFVRGGDEAAETGLDSARAADDSCPNGKCDGVGVPCFVEGTDVRLCDGSTKDIDQIEVGNRVVARDADSKQTNCRTVEETTVTPDARVLSLRIETLDGQIQTLGVTGDHPFWTRKSGWVDASELEQGDDVYTAQRRWLKVSGWNWRRRRETVYNLEVAADHTYFVGNPAVWVHNNCADDLIEAGQAVEGKFPKRSDPNDVLYRVDPDTEEVTNYQVFDSDGFPVKRVDIGGRSHAGMDKHVHEFERVTNPDGEVFVNEKKVRSARDEEIPDNH